MLWTATVSKSPSASRITSRGIDSATANTSDVECFATDARIADKQATVVEADSLTSALPELEQRVSQTCKYSACGSLTGLGVDAAAIQAANGIVKDRLP